MMQKFYAGFLLVELTVGIFLTLFFGSLLIGWQAQLSRSYYAIKKRTQALTLASSLIEEYTLFRKVPHPKSEGFAVDFKTKRDTYLPNYEYIEVSVSWKDGKNRKTVHLKAGIDL